MKFKSTRLLLLSALTIIMLPSCAALDTLARKHTGMSATELTLFGLDTSARYNAAVTSRPTASAKDSVNPRP